MKKRLERRRKSALAVISHGLCDFRNTHIGIFQELSGLFHTVLFDMGCKRGTIDGFEGGFQGCRVHMVLFRQFVNCNFPVQIFQQFIMDLPDDFRWFRLEIFILNLWDNYMFRAGNLHDLFDHQVEELALRRISGPVIDFLTIPAADDQSTVSQRAQVVGNGRTGHFQHSGDINDTLFAVAQEPENAYSGGVTQLLENLRNRLETVYAA